MKWIFALALGFTASLINSPATAQTPAQPAAQSMQPPRIRAATVNWDQARQEIRIADPVRAALAARAAPAARTSVQAVVRQRIAADQANQPPSDRALNDLALLNQSVGPRFPNVAISPVPVLLPFDAANFLKDLAESGERGAKPTAAYLSGFSSSKFFLPGPSGYDAAFELKVRDMPNLAALRYTNPIEVHISGSAILYDLSSPRTPAGATVPDLESSFPGIRRVLHESFLRYTFVRYGVPYLVSLQCGNKESIPCSEADPVVKHFVLALRVVGGTPSTAPTRPQPATIERPARTSPDFTYRPPGTLIDHSGDQRQSSGNRDYTIYAPMTFPIANAPAYANSQEFKHGGRCFGRWEPSNREPSGKNDRYRCAANDKPLVYWEGHKDNYGYPWQDNFCEIRGTGVGQCPTGLGHQGQDIRPGSCTARSENTARCKPDQHATVAVRNGYIMRSKGQEALYIVVNEPNEHIRFRYLHMSPEKMDDAELWTNRKVKQGEMLGKVGNYYSGKKNNTTYHLHFDIQVPTASGWVWVSPYMTLVAAYERLLKAKGRELSADVAAAGQN